jgi:hypothetical protein
MMRDRNLSLHYNPLLRICTLASPRRRLTCASPAHIIRQLYLVIVTLESCPLCPVDTEELEMLGTRLG